MGMPITVEIVDCQVRNLLDDAFGYFDVIDRRFSPFKHNSEITALNQGRCAQADMSANMCEILTIAEQMRRGTHGYFDIRRPDGFIDPSAVVKGWAIRNASRLVEAAGARNYLIEAGGDIQSWGKAADGTDWKIGIRNPFNNSEIVKAVCPLGHGIATSGTYARGTHIYNPHRPAEPTADIVSLTIIGIDVLQADLYATAAFAMGKDGIYFIEGLSGLEGYMIDKHGIATHTTGFSAFVS